jgi:hypothetical protein
MKKLVSIALVICLAITTVFVFHTTAFADAPATPDNGPALWITIGLSVVILSVVLIITHNNPPDKKDNDMAVSNEKSRDPEATALPAEAAKSAGTDISAPSNTLEQKLKDLKILHDSGDITDAEYKKMKAKLLLDFK